MRHSTRIYRRTNPSRGLVIVKKEKRRREEERLGREENGQRDRKQEETNKYRLGKRAVKFRRYSRAISAVRVRE